MEFKIYFSSGDRMHKAVNILEKSTKYRCTAYGRDWSESNIHCPASPMYYIEFVKT